jgi:hypothetical protein
MILNDILGVHSKSSNTAVKCELGMFPLSITCYGLMYGYYSRLNQIDEQWVVLDPCLKLHMKLTNY